MVGDGSASPHPPPPDRSKPLFPKCFYSAINDSYEIAFVGIIEFLERSLEEYSQHVALLEAQAPPLSHCAPSSTSGTEGETERYFRLPKTEEPLTTTTTTGANRNVRNIFSAEALHDLVAKTSTTPIAIDPDAGPKICRAVRTEEATKSHRQQQQQQGENETSIEHDTKCTLIHSPRELCDLVSKRSAVSSSHTPAPPLSSPTQQSSVVSCGERTCPHTQKLSPLQPTDKTVFSPSHLGISFNAGKDSMVMLHIVLNAIERLVEIGDWVCDRYGVRGGRGAVTLVKPHHMDRFREWRSVLANKSDLAVPRMNGDQRGRKCERPNPCHNPILSFLLSHLCIFYFEDKDEIEEMRVFIEALLDGLDFPVFTMANNGTLSVKPEGKSSHPSNDDQTAAVGDDVIAARSADTAEFTPIGGCGRFHSRNHHADCPLILEAIRSPLGKQTHSISSLPSYSDMHKLDATTENGGDGESAPAKVLRAASFRARPSVSGTSETNVCSPQLARRPLLYYGAKVICVAEGSGMSDGLALLKQHVGVHFAFLGVRCEDIVGWRQDPIEMTSKGWPTLLRVCPIFSWTYEQVWMYLFYYNVPFCHLYSMGITSCGPSARTVRNPQCIVPLEDPIPPSAGALSRLHKNNLFNPSRHSIHPYDPRASSGNRQNATSCSSSPCALVNISIDRMWPAVCESSSGAVLRDNGPAAFGHDTENLSLDILSCWKLWWDVQAHGDKIEPLGKGIDAKPLVTATWDPAEVDFNASHFFKHVAGKNNVAATDASHDQHAPATTFLVDGGPYDPQSPFISLSRLVPGEQNAPQPAGGCPSVAGANRALYALPAWLLREGALERQSRLPAPRKEQAVPQPRSCKSSL